MAIHHQHGHSSQTREGMLIHWSGPYEAVFGRFLRRSEPRIIELAKIKPGNTVLDMGCGPGGLTRTAKAAVGPSGKVFGIDAAEEMITLARQKASGAGLEIDFRVGLAQAMPYPDQTFDVVISRLFIHHLPGKALQMQAFGEVLRVLKPGGICFIVDFDLPSLPVLGKPLKMIMKNHAMPQSDVKNIAQMLQDAGFQEVSSGPTGKALLAYATGRK